MYGYYELTNTISDEKFEDYYEVEMWAVNTFGFYDPDYLFMIDEEDELF